MSDHDSERVAPRPDSPRTDRELLLKVTQEVRFLREDLKERERERVESLQRTVFSPIQDHEARIRILENFRWWIIGAIAVSNAAAALFGKFMH